MSLVQLIERMRDDGLPLGAIARLVGHPPIAVAAALGAWVSPEAAAHG